MQRACVTSTQFPIVTMPHIALQCPQPVNGSGRIQLPCSDFTSSTWQCVGINFSVICHTHGSVSPPPRSRSWVASSQVYSWAFIATASSLLVPDHWQTLICFTYLPCHFTYAIEIASHSTWAFGFGYCYSGTFLWSTRELCASSGLVVVAEEYPTVWVHQCPCGSVKDL